MRRVVIESPYAGDIEANVAYAKEAILDCLRRGEAPIASHLLFTQPGVLDDATPEQRQLGIQAGHAWIRKSDAVVVYADLGISKGMEAGMRVAVREYVRIEFRYLRNG